MKVIFLKDVLPGARAGDVKEIRDGYGRNFLLPRKLAVLATRDALQRATALRAAADERRRKESADWRDITESLAETPMVIQMRAGPTGRLYGSVTSAQIADKLTELIGRPVDRRGVRIPAPIRQVGTFTVPVRFFENVTADIRVVVETEGDGDDDGKRAAATGEDSAEPAEAGGEARNGERAGSEDSEETA